MSNTENSFISWEYSLLGVPQDTIKNLLRSPVGKWTCDMNFDSAILLLKQDYSNAEQQIKRVLLKDPDNIQAWNNKGYLLTMQGKCSEEPWSNRNRLLATNPAKFFEAKVEYSNWLYNFVRKEDAKQRAIYLLDEIFENPIEGDQQHFLHLKVLSFELKKTDGKQKRILQKWIAELKWFKEQEESDEVLIWSHITEAIVHCANKKGTKLPEVLSELATNLNTKEDITLKLCANRLSTLVTTGDHLVSGNLYAKTAKALAFCDMKTVFVDVDKSIKRLEWALDIGEMYSIAEKGGVELGPKTCGIILLDLWVLNYYKHHEEEVKEKTKYMLGSPFMFLKNSYYPETEDTELRQWLIRAKDHLKKHVEQKSANWILMWPRVLALLGERREAVEEAFHQEGRYKTEEYHGRACNSTLSYHVNLGEYLLSIDDVELAKESFAQALASQQGGLLDLPRAAKDLINIARTWTNKL